MSPAALLSVCFLLLSSCLAPSSPPQAGDLVLERSLESRAKPDPSSLVFGKHFSDHMLTVSWSEGGGWEAPHIRPFQNLSLHPASSALHYSIEVRPRPQDAAQAGWAVT